MAKGGKGQVKKIRGSIKRVRGRLQNRQHQVEDLGLQTEQQLDKNFFDRVHRLRAVWRFVITWLALFLLLLGCLVVQNQVLSGQYQTLGPVPGGIYSEGVLGTFTNANPIYATSEADVTVAHLVFSGLLKYDANNQLEGDLAESWKVNDRGTVYTFRLRPGLKWQDGQNLTAKDVVFTYQTIQNPDAQSPFNSSWSNITVIAPDDRTVVFTLANPLISFPYNLTGGILPAHLLAKVPAADLRSANFNTTGPIGSGPFQWDALEVNGTTPATAEVRIALKPFADYWQGAPKLRSFVVRAYPEAERMIRAYKHRDLTSMAGLNTVPADLSDDTVVHNLRLNAATMLFFKTSAPMLNDAKVRGALIKAVDQEEVLQKLDYTTRAVTEPFLRGQVGFDAKYQQPGYDPVQAKADLAAAGWVAGRDGILAKNGQRLAFDLFADDNQEYARVARYISAQWRKVGVAAHVNLLSSEDLKSTLASHEYDAVLHGIAIGSDSDVFVYWDSSQADIRSANRLNFSEYKSTASDASLQAGRSTVDVQLRTIKYRPFLANWQKDLPAMGLYQPRYLYITRGEVYGLTDHSINSGVDRLANANEWMIRTAGITQD
jgi:peptide/nickel transport system substrate-binding protein